MTNWNPLIRVRRQLGLTALFIASALQAAPLKEFVTVRGDQLFEGRKPFRFVSFNIPNLHLVEDNMVFDKENAWRWPDKFEIADALESIRQQGGRVARTYVLSVQRTNDLPGIPRHVLAPGTFNEEGFRVLDEVLQTANQKGVRVIIPFVDNWSWWGGITEYAGFRGKAREAFWTDPQITADFKETVRFLVSRTNTLTGIPYHDDKAILCWETGNELQAPAEWTREIAAFIHSLDSNHPVMDGYHTTELRTESLSMSEIDIVTTHHYPGGKQSFAELIRNNAAKAKGRKPYVVGEFGFVPMREMAEALAAVHDTSTAGALAWSLRFRNRDGGFYWHSEPAGGDKYKAFHWPGFATGKEYDEAPFMALMQREAFAIRGESMPAPRAPAPPLLLQTATASLSWQGSAGATFYQVERSPGRSGPWSVIARQVDETFVQYRPLFVDTNAPEGSWYYRVRAANGDHGSRPSNVIGPVQIRHRLFIDEFASTAFLADKTGVLREVSNESRKAREDIHRLEGEPGSAIVYRLPGEIQTARLYSFFPAKQAAFKFSVSVNGREFRPVRARASVAAADAGDYGYWTPALYECHPGGLSGNWLRIEFTERAQLSRLEMEYAARP